jgi:hypothetical protein
LFLELTEGVVKKELFVIKILILILGVVPFLMSCAVTIQSTVRPGYSHSLKNLYVILYSEFKVDAAQSFMAGLAKQLEQDLPAYGVSCKSHVYNEMAFDEKASIKKEMDTFFPDMEMIITQKQLTYAYGVPCAGSFMISMSEPNDSAYVWKALFETSPGGYAGLSYPGNVSKTIIDQLIKDGMLKTYGNTAKTGR